MKIKYSHFRNILILTLLTIFFSSENVLSQTRRALLIGIDQYKPIATSNSRPIRGSWSNLDGAVNDALSVKELLISRFGFKEENITMLLDSLGTTKLSATKENIISIIKEKLVDPAKEGDIVFFYYAGHGSQIKNSKSPEKDQKDETIVPSDSYLGTKEDIRDIRDKEMALLFNEIVDKGVILTLIFDSCHSGSIARGKEDDYKVRKLEPIDIDIADPTVYPRPEEREGGALVISAAQDYQTAKETKDENGNPHGAFTSAFLKAIRTSSVNESAQSIFARIKAIVQSTGRDQNPVIAGPDERRKQTLFGISTEDLENKTVVAVLKKNDGEIIFQGGLAVGLREGAELEKISSSKDVAKIRVKVVEERGLNKCIVSIIEGNESDISPGDLFEVKKWVIPDDMTLNIYIPEMDYEFDKLLTIAKELSQLQLEKNITISDEPVDENINYEIYYLNLEWKLKNLVDGKVEDLGKHPNVEKIKELFEGNDITLFINLPLSIEIVEEIKTKLGIPKGAIQLTGQKEAKYFLNGRILNDKLEYAFYLPEMVNRENTFSSLPLISDWIEISGTENINDEVNKINDVAFKLAKLNAWLTLEVPEDEGNFPYRLALRNSSTGILVTEGNVVEGDTFGLTLVLDSLLLKDWDKNKRWIYVISIDSYGETTLFYPLSGNVENREPEERGPLPSEIPLGRKKLFRVGKPFGPDTYILLTSYDQIPNPEMMESKGVKTRSTTRGNPLMDLFSNIGTTTRGGKPIMLVDWSLNRITTISVEK
ncbi:MAG: caspase family protein [Promethearchaeota archaeon]